MSVYSLENSILVYIFYLTSMDEQGEINFREDLYQLDKKLTRTSM
ncbi:hypothetical protein [Nafulsella turpanensis]|nr:hypothetical protein [Nafulsella turpanensis]